MRIPLVTQLSSKDGSSNKNARMTNTLVAKNPTGTSFAEVRPGLNRLADTTGNGNGIVDFNGEIFSVYGSELDFAVIPPRLGSGLIDISEWQDGTILVSGSPSDSDADGSVIAGSDYDSGAYSGFLWVEATGLALIGSLGGTPDRTLPFAVSPDGLTILGTSKNVSGVVVPFVWTEATGCVAVAGFSADTTIRAATKDLTSFCGLTGNVGYIYTPLGGVETFTVGTAFIPNAIAEDGTVFGQANVSSQMRFVRRDTNNSVVNIGAGLANCCSADGKTAYGYSGVSPSNYPAKWTLSGGLVALSAEYGKVTSCSYDGVVAAGFVVTDEGKPFTYKSNSGMEIINVLGLYECTGTITDSNAVVKISSDGSTLVAQLYLVTDSGNEYSWMIYNKEYGHDTQITVGSSLYLDFALSDDGWVSSFAAWDDVEQINILYKWDRDTGIFRSIATLEDQFFDFAQSTL